MFESDALKIQCVLGGGEGGGRGRAGGTVTHCVCVCVSVCVCLVSSLFSILFIKTFRPTEQFSSSVLSRLIFLVRYLNA